MMRKTFGFSRLDPGLRLDRINPVVVAFFAASATLMSCGGGSSGSAGGGFTVALSTPASTVFTHGVVAVEVSVSGGTPDRVELLKDGALLVSLLPPYRYNWDTSSTPEGEYHLVGRATQGRQSFTSEPRTVVVDRTPPAVASRVPAPNASNIFVDDRIVVGFTKPLLPASVVPAAFALRSGSTPVPTTPWLLGDGKTVMLLRHTNLAVPATLTLTVSGSITDLAGNALVAADAWSWSVPDWVTVGGPINVASTQDAYQPALALDRSGKPVVLFHEYDGTYRKLYVQRWTGTAWQSLGGAINAVPAQDDPPDPAIALDGNGTPVLCFRERDGHYNLYVRQWRGSSWQAVGGPINAVPGYNVHELEPAQALALDGNGMPVVAFSEYDGQYSNVYVRHWTGSNWQSVGEPINAVTGHSVSTPVLALDGNSRPIVAFSESDGHYSNVYVRQWMGSNWQSVGGAINAVPGRDAFWPVLALDGSGTPVVAFFESDGTHYNVYVRRWTGSDWQSVGAPLNAVPGHNAGLPVLAQDGNGRPVVAFSESDGTHYSVYVRHSNQ